MFFHAKPTEMWICPACEETGVFNVISISHEEITEMYKSLDYTPELRLGEQKKLGRMKLKLPPIVSESQGIYISVARKEGMKDALFILPLLFDRVFMSNLSLLLDLIHVSKNNSSTISNLLDSEIIIPIAQGSETVFFTSFGEKVKPILSSALMNYTAMTNLITSLADEDIRAMDSNLRLELEKKLRRFYGNGIDVDFFSCLENELEKYNRDLLIARRTGFPMVIEPLIDEIHRWKMKRIAGLFRTEVSKEVSIAKRFLKSLNISIPTNLTFDDIVSFRKEKASTSFRDTLFSLSKNFQQDLSSDIAQDLLARFYQKKMEFNELANSYAETRTLLLTGTVSTLGGLLGGPAGAIIGGLGTSLISPITKVVFRKLYEDAHKDWVYFFWKWQKKSARKLKKE